eukprot:160692-Pelagomonas_calceolata.AAC.1
MDTVRQAQDMSMTDQISWFIDGLQSDLISHCAVQPSGHPWHSLSDLVRFAIGEEARMHATRTAANRASASRVVRTDWWQLSD